MCAGAPRILRFRSLPSRHALHAAFGSILILVCLRAGVDALQQQAQLQSMPTLAPAVPQAPIAATAATAAAAAAPPAATIKQEASAATQEAAPASQAPSEASGLPPPGPSKPGLVLPSAAPVPAVPASSSPSLSIPITIRTSAPMQMAGSAPTGATVVTLMPAMHGNMGTAGTSLPAQAPASWSHPLFIRNAQNLAQQHAQQHASNPASSAHILGTSPGTPMTPLGSSPGLGERRAAVLRMQSRLRAVSPRGPYDHTSCLCLTTHQLRMPAVGTPVLCATLECYVLTP